MNKRHINISLPSLRIDAFSLDVMSKVQDVKKSSLTFAPEAGSQRLRDVINKGLTEEVILQGSALAFEGGWTRVKLYFMLGHPTETEEDIRGIAELSNKIAATFFDTVPKEKRVNGRVQIVTSTSFFVPKPFTPFQWAPQCTKEEFVEKAYLTRKAISEQLNQKSIKYNWHEADVSVLEGVLARGDRRLSQVLLYVYHKGCFYDAWSEYFHNDVWMEAFCCLRSGSGFLFPQRTTPGRDPALGFPGLRCLPFFPGERMAEGEKRDDLTELQTGMSGLRCRQIRLRYLRRAQRLIVRDTPLWHVIEC